MKRYKYGDWDFEWIDENHPGGFDTRLYVDDDGNPITGILEGFYYFEGTTGTSDPKNCREVVNGRIV